jgi:hypothetical protein
MRFWATVLGNNVGGHDQRCGHVSGNSGRLILSRVATLEGLEPEKGSVNGYEEKQGSRLT